MMRSFTALIQKEEDMYVALCPEVDIVSQGVTIEEAKSNLREALELFLEYADSQEVTDRLHSEQYVSTVEVAFG
jgi:predicted RNase H-like HicB family nuclease